MPCISFSIGDAIASALVSTGAVIAEAGPTIEGAPIAATLFGSETAFDAVIGGASSAIIGAGSGAIIGAATGGNIGADALSGLESGGLGGILSGGLLPYTDTLSKFTSLPSSVISGLEQIAGGVGAAAATGKNIEQAAETGLIGAISGGISNTISSDLLGSNTAGASILSGALKTGLTSEFNQILGLGTTTANNPALQLAGGTSQLSGIQALQVGNGVQLGGQFGQTPSPGPYGGDAFSTTQYDSYIASQEQVASQQTVDVLGSKITKTVYNPEQIVMQDTPQAATALQAFQTSGTPFLMIENPTLTAYAEAQAIDYNNQVSTEIAQPYYNPAGTKTDLTNAQAQAMGLTINNAPTSSSNALGSITAATSAVNISGLTSALNPQVANTNNILASPQLLNILFNRGIGQDQSASIV